MLLKPEIELRNGFKCERYLARVRELECLACEIEGSQQTEPTEAHHKIGEGLGLKASDLLTMGICNKHHNGNFRSDKKGNAIHHTVLKDWEAKFKSQILLIEMTNERIFSRNDLKGQDLRNYELIKNYINNKK